MQQIRKVLGRTIADFVLALFAALILSPFALMLVTSLRTMKEVARNGPISWPNALTFDNYIKAWTKGDFMINYKSSVIITVCTVVISLLVIAMASYAIVYLDLPGRKIIMPLILFGLMVPFEQIMLPLFANLRAYGWINKYVSVIIPQAAMAVPMGIVLVTTFMKKVPFDIIEAARIDGASEIGILVGIVTPMVKPILSTILVFVAMSSWNNFMLPNIMLQASSVRTITVGLNAFRKSNSADFPLIAAATFIVALPIIVIYIIFQKKIQEGMTAGSVKE